MTTYLIRRFFQTVLFIFLAWLSIYTVLVYLMPNGPMAAYDRAQQVMAGLAERGAVQPKPNTVVGPGGPVDDRPSIEAELKGLGYSYGVDKPWPLSFLAWLYDPADTLRIDKDNNEVPFGLNFDLGGWHIQGSGILTGDLGVSNVSARTSFGTGDPQPVIEVLGAKWANSFLLVGLSFVVALLFAIPAGMITALKHRSKLDHAMTLASFTGFSMPPFMLGTLLVVLFGVLPYQMHQRGLDWMPYLPVGYIADDGQYDNWLNRAYHLVLPVLTLALPQIAWLSRQLRFSMLDVMRNDYVRTARAKGLSPFRVVSKHTLRNALLPLITSIALAIPVFISGAIMVETVFAYGGMGQIYFRALGGCLATGATAEFFCPPSGALLPLDYPMTLALTLIIVVVVAVVNMIADALYALVDPRVNYDDKAKA
ncbi:MAG: ABC transporter permease [Chloroflexota bacterium]